MSNFGKYQGYICKPCINCGRYRVEHFSNGFDVCEKCLWCPQLDNYVADYDFFEDNLRIKKEAKNE